MTLKPFDREAHEEHLAEVLVLADAADKRRRAKRVWEVAKKRADENRRVRGWERRHGRPYGTCEHGSYSPCAECSPNLELDTSREGT